MKKTKSYKILFVIIIILSLTFCQICFGYDNTGLKWASPGAIYNYNSTLPSGWTMAIGSAASTWSGYSKFKFSYSSTSSNYWGAFAGGTSSGAVASTTVYYSGTTISQVGTIYNTSFSISPNPSTTQYDLLSVTLHEFGHWLKLGDVYADSYKTSAMYGYLSPGQKKQSLATDDINGICSIYN